MTFLLATSAFAQSFAQRDSAAPQQQEAGPVRWDGPSLRIGESVRLDPRVRLQADFLVDDRSNPIEDRFSWGSRRIGVNGELFKRVEFQIERALQDDDDDDTAWRDVYGDVRINRALQIRGGRFKVPFSMERTTSRDELDFLQRATAVRALSPTRDTGVMVHGRVADRLVGYEAAVMRHADGLDVPSDSNLWGSLGAMLAARLSIDPVRDNKESTTRDLHFGVAFVRNAIPEGLNGVVGRTFSGDRFFERMNVNGQRTRLGAEGLWNAGRFTLKGELIQLTDQRTAQAVTGEDLSDLIHRGGYVTGIYRVFGEHGKRAQAVDVAARLDRLSMSSANQTDEPFTNPRADHVAPLSKNTWTFGATYQVNRYIRVQGNLIREVLVDPLNVRELTFGTPWTTVVRFQFAL
jgi:phosphate-selective porin